MRKEQLGKYVNVRCNERWAALQQHLVVQRTSQVLHVHFLGNIGADQSEALDLGLKPSLESEIRLREVNLKFPVWGLRILVSFSFGSSRVGARGHWLVLVSILESTL